MSGPIDPIRQYESQTTSPTRPSDENLETETVI